MRTKEVEEVIEQVKSEGESRAEVENSPNKDPELRKGWRSFREGRLI